MAALATRAAHWLAQKEYYALEEMLLTLNETETASLFSLLPKESAVALFALLPKDRGTALFAHVLREGQEDEEDAERLEEDIALLSAVTPNPKPYLKRSVGELYRARIPWLLLLMLSATLTSSIIGAFEEALSKLVILTAFIPMLMGTGGNAGGQSSITVIRALSMEEVAFSDLWRVLWKEVRVAFLTALTLSAVQAGKMLLFGEQSLLVTLVVSLTLAAVVLLSKMVGCLLPLLALRIGFDPAVTAGPFVTTVVDAVTLLLYFTLAKALLPL